MVCKQCAFLPTDDLSVFGPDPLDFVVDACDSIESKFRLITQCHIHKVRIVTSMGFFFKMDFFLLTGFLSSKGMARRRDPTCIRVAPIHRTKNDPLASMLRRRLRQANMLEALEQTTVQNSECLTLTLCRPCFL